MKHTRDYVWIKGEPVLHSTARRDWMCGVCGGALTTRWFVATPYPWRTVCANDPDHDPDEFIHESAWVHIEHRRHTEAAQAQDVYDHLPAEMQAAIDERS